MEDMARDRKAKDRVVAALQAARPLNAWLEREVG